MARPLVPLSIFRVPGLAAAHATQVIALAGFYSAYFFVTLYMQDVLGFSAFRAGSAYVPVTIMVAVAAGAGAALITRIGTPRRSWPARSSRPAGCSGCPDPRARILLD